MTIRKALRIPLTGRCGDRRVVREWTVVADDEFGRSLFDRNWCLLKIGHYAVRGIGPRGSCRLVLMHRDVFRHYHGEIKSGFEIDHIDRNPLNNTFWNLRLTTRGENAANTGKRVDNTSGYRGVCFSRGKWLARFRFLGKTKHLGYHSTKKQAAMAVYEESKRCPLTITLPHPAEVYGDDE